MARSLATILVVTLAGISQQFRSIVTAVPIEVRVTNERGEPVRELSAADFTIKENGHVQRIAHFEYHNVESNHTTSGGRTFLVVLGRGRLNEPSKALEGLAHFTRTQLLAGDRIGVFAFRHVLPPTQDHEMVATFFDRYRTTHEQADALLDRDDRVMTFPRLIGPDTRAAIERVLGNDEIRTRLTELAGADSPHAISYGTFPSLRNALYFSRTISGEKHVIVVTQGPLPVGRPHSKVTEGFWFQQATSARATLHLINTQGIHGRVSQANPAMMRSNIPSTLERQRLGEFSEETGGSSSYFEYTERALARIERVTRSYYVLAYYPLQETAPNEYRQISVEVHRANIKVLYRKGYQAQAPVETPPNAREAQAAGRLEYGLAWTASREYPGPQWPGLEIAIDASQRKPGEKEVQIAIAFHPKFTAFTQRNDRYVAEFDLALVAEDERRNEIGRLQRRLTVDLSAQEFEMTKKGWPTFDLRVPVTGQAQHVRAVLYQYETDRLALNRIKVRR